jgi:hypothetical protein
MRRLRSGAGLSCRLSSSDHHSRRIAPTHVHRGELHWCCRLASLQRFEKFCCRSRESVSGACLLMPCVGPSWLNIYHKDHSPHFLPRSTRDRLHSLDFTISLSLGKRDYCLHQASTMGNTLHDVEGHSTKLSSEEPDAGAKDASVTSDGHAIPSEFDADGEVKQDGVRRTEAITSVWNKKTLVFVFVTYVTSLRQPLTNSTANPLRVPVYISLNSSNHCFRPCSPTSTHTSPLRLASMG